MSNTSQDTSKIEQMIDQYYEEIELSHAKIDQSACVKESTPLKAIGKQNTISDFFKVVNTTPNSNKRAKRKVISPLQDMESEDSMDEENIGSTVTSISYKLDAFKQTFETNMDIVMNKLKEEVLGELKDFKERILQTVQARDKAYDKKLKALEDKLDDFKESVTFQEQEIEDLKSENAKMLQRCQIYEGQIAKNEKEIQFIKEDTLQIQAKSMSANLVFHNIPEQGNENSQMTGDILLTFIRDELKVTGYQSYCI